MLGNVDKVYLKHYLSCNVIRQKLMCTQGCLYTSRHINKHFNNLSRNNLCLKTHSTDSK